MAKDLPALVKWYVDVLGFKTTREFTGEYTYTNLENDAGIQIGIASANEMGVSPLTDKSNNSVVLQFEVDDVPAFFKHLQEHGGVVTFGPSKDEPHGFWYGGFSDPEGNPFWVVDVNCP